jgi:hypothetical protein
MGADKNSSQRRWKLQQGEHGFQHTSPTQYPSWPSPRSHWSATGPMNQHTSIRPENAAEHQPRVHGPTLVRLVSTTGQTGPYWGNLATSTERLHTGQTDATHRSDRSQPESPKHQTGQPSSKPTQTRNSCNTGQQRTHPDVHPSKNPTGVAPVRPVRGTGQTGVTWASQDEQHPRVNTSKSKP